MPRFREMAEEAGRNPTSLSVTLGGAPEDLAVLRRNRDLGVTRMTVRLHPAKEEEILGGGTDRGRGIFDKVMRGSA